VSCASDPAECGHVCARGAICLPPACCSLATHTCLPARPSRWLRAPSVYHMPAVWLTVLLPLGCCSRRRARTTPAAASLPAHSATCAVSRRGALQQSRCGATPETRHTRATAAKGAQPAGGRAGGRAGCGVAAFDHTVKHCYTHPPAAHTRVAAAFHVQCLLRGHTPHFGHRPPLAGCCAVGDLRHTSASFQLQHRVAVEAPVPGTGALSVTFLLYSHQSERPFHSAPRSLLPRSALSAIPPAS
jgi:hypothetical protein